MFTFAAAGKCRIVYDRGDNDDDDDIPSSSFDANKTPLAPMVTTRCAPFGLIRSRTKLDNSFQMQNQILMSYYFLKELLLKEYFS